MQIAPTTAAAILVMGLGAHAQVPSPPPVGTAPVAPGPVVPAPVVPPVALGARAFTAPTGIIFNAVRPERVVDFEMVIGYLQAAFDQSTDAARASAGLAGVQGGGTGTERHGALCVRNRPHGG